MGRSLGERWRESTRYACCGRLARGLTWSCIGLTSCLLVGFPLPSLLLSFGGSFSLGFAQLLTPFSFFLVHIGLREIFIVRFLGIARATALIVVVVIVIIVIVFLPG
jgi:hypothetical protein